MKQDNKSIVIINQDSGYLMIDIANAYQKAGFKVSLITGRLVQRNKPLHQTIRISKLIRYNRTNKVKRLVTWSIASLQILLLLWFKYRKEHLLIISNPPTATLLPLISKNTYSLLIYDVYPDILVEYNILKEGSFLVKKWKKANRRIFNDAKRIITLSSGMKENLSQYIDNSKIEVIPIWTDNSFLKPMLKVENSFLIEQELEHKFIILYSGNLGRTHHIEILLDLAEKLSEPPYFFLIIGGGDQYGFIKKEIDSRKLPNVKLMSWQAPEKLPLTLAAADIGVVSLGDEGSNFSIPSKTFNLMSVGVPILSIASSESALATLIEENQIGKNFEKDNIQDMLTFVTSLFEDENKRLSYRERALETSKNFSPDNALKFVD